MYDLENMDPEFTDNRGCKEKLKYLFFCYLISGGVITAFVGSGLLLEEAYYAIKNHKTQRSEQPYNQTNSIDTIRIKNYYDTVKQIKNAQNDVKTIKR